MVWYDDHIIGLLRWLAMSEPAKFRKKVTATVTAIQFWPPGDERHNPEFCRVGCKPGEADIGTITEFKPDGNVLWYSMRTISGWASLHPGDWIIMMPQREHTPEDIYPCKREVFEATYEPV